MERNGIGSALKIDSSKFSKQFSRFHQKHKYVISNCLFSASESPIRLSFGSQQTKEGSRKQFSGDFSLSNSRFEFCHSLTENGGALFAANAKGIIAGCYFYQGSAIKGGAMFGTGGSLTLSSCHAIKCASKHDGSAYFFRGASVSFDKGTIAYCKSGHDAALCVVLGTCNINDMKIYQNHASNNYGGICLNETQGLSILLYFSKNDAQGEIGKSLMIWSAQEYILENSYFYDSAEKQLAYSDDGSIRFNSLYFASGTIQIYVVVNGGGGESYPNFVPIQPVVKPVLPPELLQDIFEWDVTEPNFQWKGMYIIAAIFAIAFSIIWIFIPIVISPQPLEYQYKVIAFD